MVNFMVVRSFHIVGEQDHIKNLIPLTTLFICSPSAEKISGRSPSRRAKRKGVMWEMNFCPPAPRRRRGGCGKVFPQFLRQQESKSEKF